MGIKEPGRRQLGPSFKQYETLPGLGAISAVKALSKASAAGQRIYQITQANCNPPIINRVRKQTYAALANFCFGVMPPNAMFGRS